MEKIYKLLKSSVKEDIELALNLLLRHTEEEIVNFMNSFKEGGREFCVDIELGTYFECLYIYIKLIENLRLCIPDNNKILRMRSANFADWKIISKENYLNGMY